MTFTAAYKLSELYRTLDYLLWHKATTRCRPILTIIRDYYILFVCYYSYIYIQYTDCNFWSVAWRWRRALAVVNNLQETQVKYNLPPHWAAGVSHCTCTLDTTHTYCVCITNIMLNINMLTYIYVYIYTHIFCCLCCLNIEERLHVHKHKLPKYRIICVGVWCVCEQSVDSFRMHQLNWPFMQCGVACCSHLCTLKIFSTNIQVTVVKWTNLRYTAGINQHIT